MPGYCGAWSLVAEVEGIRIAVPLRCRSWKCPICAPRLKRRMARLLQTVEAHRFVTLTCDPRRWASQDAAYRGMSKAVEQLVKRVRRKWPRAEFEYFMVWELTLRGWPHIHMLTRGVFIPQSWLSEQWADLTGAPIVYIERVHQSEQAAAELAKYLAKDARVPRDMKRYRCSRQFLPGERIIDFIRPRATFPWEVFRGAALEVRRLWSVIGLSVRAYGDDMLVGVPREFTASLDEWLRTNQELVGPLVCEISSPEAFKPLNAAP